MRNKRFARNARNTTCAKYNKRVKENKAMSIKQPSAQITKLLTPVMCQTRETEISASHPLFLTLTKVNGDWLKKRRSSSCITGGFHLYAKGRTEGWHQKTKFRNREFRNNNSGDNQQPRGSTYRRKPLTEAA